MNKPVLILETGAPLPSLRHHGGFGHWIRVAAGLRRGQFETVRVDAGEPLPDPASAAAMILSGSAAMVSDRLPWSESCAAWLREAHARALPMLGICYGHQLLAHALGGVVGNHPQGREMGTVEIVLDRDAEGDALLAGQPARFRVQMSHLQTVLERPPGTRVLAHSRHDRHAVLHFGGRCWGVQFHPEFSVTHMRGYVRGRAPALRAEGLDPAGMEACVAPTPWARRLLRRFVRIALAGTERPR